MIERQRFHRLSTFPRSVLDEVTATRAGQSPIERPEPGRNSFKAIAFPLLGRLTALSTTC